MNSESHKLSTSALAKQLGIPLQQLFVTLRDYGWIRKLEDGWELTSKGEFEGGEYVHSKRYGRYIVWPEALPEHPLLAAMERNRFVNAAQIGRKFSLHAREVRRLFSEIGLLQRGVNGWELSARGEQLGGLVLDTENDLLAAVNDFRSLDGHHFRSRGEWQICNWLYLAGIVHACHRQLPFGNSHEPLYADFWLPEAGLYLEYNGDDRDAAALSASLQRVELYRQQHWPFIEVQADQLAELDDLLTRQLRRRGVRVW